MKKVFTLIGIIAAFCSCDKADKLELPMQEEQVNLEVEFEINDGSMNTKAVKTNWANNDKVYVFFDGSAWNSGASYLVMKYKSSESKWVVDQWVGKCKSTLSKRTSGKLSAIYSPVDKVYGSISVSTSLMYLYTKDSHQYNGYVLQAQNVTYTIADGKLTATINLGVPGGQNVLQFWMDAKHRDGTSIKNGSATESELDRYYMTIDKSGGSGSYVQGFVLKGYNSDGTFTYNNSQHYLSPYYYQGMCFSCKDFTISSPNKIKILLIDRVSSKAYMYMVTLSNSASWNNKTTKAFKLPSLDAKDGDNYRWVEVTN